MPTAIRLAVVGGGITGLTAAYRLHQLLPAARIELFEASDRLGGVLSTHRSGDTLLELGADSFIDKLPMAVELCQEVGLGDQLIPTNEAQRRALVLHDGKLHPVPQGFVQMRPEQYGPMLRTELLSWRGKSRLLAERWIPSPIEIANVDYDESVASFATRRLGREVFQRLVQPLVAGIYTADPYQLSVAATMSSALKAEKKHGSLRGAVLARGGTANENSSSRGARYASFVTLRGGLSELVDALAKRLALASLHLNHSLSGLAQAADHRWSITHSSAKNPEVFDGVVVALPAPRAANLLATTDTELSYSLSRISYASSAVVGLLYRRDQIKDPLNGFGVVVPTIENRRIVAASFSSVKFPGRAPDEQVLIRVFLGGALQPELLERTDGELVDLAHAELRVILGIEDKPLRADLVRWNEKMPQYHVGHLQLVERIERQIDKLPGLELAGNAYHGVGIPQCVASGDKAARRLAESLKLIRPARDE